MTTDVATLWDFYYGSHLGAVAQRHLQRALRTVWPDIRGCTLAGYGFAVPLLRPFKAEATRTVAMMPDTQGARRWPRGETANCTALVEAERLPLPTGFVDRMIVAHGIESEARLDALMGEIWRVLAPEGKVLIVAPNRAGVWARGDGTPFGDGRPWSAGQIARLLRDHDLTPISRTGALYLPPTERRFWLRGAGLTERIGQRLDAQRLAGALIVEAGKQVFAMPRSGSKVKAGGGLLEPLRGLGPRPVGVGARDG